MAVFMAMLFDGLDGRVARLTSTETAFGKEYDSLADMVAFGVAPAIVSYQWGVARIAEYGKAWDRFGWLAAFFYAVAAALRLANFNSRVQDKRYFEGLPSPSAAAIVAAFIWASSEWREPGLPGLILAFTITAAAGALMVSRFSYPSFKNFDLTRPVRFMSLVVVVLVIIVIAQRPRRSCCWQCSAAMRSGRRSSGCGVACAAGGGRDRARAARRAARLTHESARAISGALGLDVWQLRRPRRRHRPAPSRCSHDAGRTARDGSPLDEPAGRAPRPANPMRSGSACGRRSRLHALRALRLAHPDGIRCRQPPGASCW